MVQLYDFRNRPINMSELRREAKPRFRSGRTTGWVNITDGTQVDPEWISSAIRSMERGDHRSYALFAERIKERFIPFMSAVGELSDGLGGEFRLKPASQSRDDRKISEAVYRVVKGDAFQLALTDLRDAMPVGWSNLEMQWDVDSEGRFVPMRFLKVPSDAIKFADDGCTPMILAPGWQYEPLEWGRFISHVSRLRSGLPVNVGMAKSCAYLYMFESFAWSAWSGYLERFGHPFVTATHRKGAAPEEIAALEDAVATLTAEGSLVYEDTMGIKILEHVAASGNANGAGFRDFIAAVGKQTRVAVLGVDMTDTSSGSRALGEVLERKVEARKRTIAFQESATLRRDLVRAIMAVNFEGGAVRPAPYLHLDIEDNADMKELAEGLGPLIDRGAQVRVAEVLDRCGLPIPEGMDEALLMYPLNSQAAMQNAGDAPAAEAKAAAAHLAELKATERADGYARAIMRIVDACDEPEIRKRDLVPRIKSVAREFGFDVKAEKSEEAA